MEMGIAAITQRADVGGLMLKVNRWRPRQMLQGRGVVAEKYRPRTEATADRFRPAPDVVASRPGISLLRRPAKYRLKIGMLVFKAPETFRRSSNDGSVISKNAFDQWFVSRSNLTEYIFKRDEGGRCPEMIELIGLS
jgi:hypothetical protein